MGKGFKKGAGGANPLNFKVVGGTAEPANPKENLIWVNTDQKITAWAFVADEPSNPVGGMVWFGIGTPSIAEFNALKKNSVQVYPTSAKQYVSGKWVIVTAKVFKSGAWVAMETYLYNNGDEATFLTGGWVSQGANVSKGTTALVISYDGESGTTSGYAKTSKAVDFTGYDRIEVLFDYSCYNASSDSYFTGNAYLAVYDASGKEVAGTTMVSKSVKYKNTEYASNVTATLDISALSDGKYYVYIGSKNVDYRLTNTITLRKAQLK